MHAPRVRRPDHRLTAVGVVAVLLIWPAAAASASTGTAPGGDRAAAVQTVLDRVLGPGNATVVVSDSVRTSSGTSTSVRWGSGVAASSATDLTVAGGVTSVAHAQQDLVGGTTTSLSTPPGTLLSRSVSVAVDRAHLGSTSLTALKRLVTSSAGIVRSRGDRVSVVVARFARPAPVTPPAVTPLSLLLPWSVPALWAVGALVALLVLATAVRGARRSAGAVADR